MVNDVTSKRLSELAGRRDGPVLSVFLDLDPSSSPTPAERGAAVDSALHTARGLLGDADLERDADQHLRTALEGLGERLQEVVTGAQGARGAVAYAHGSDGSVELLRLPAPVPAGVVLEASPSILPLLRFAARERWCVALVDGTGATFLLGDEDGLEVTGGFDDDVHQHVRHGGGGQGYWNLQRSIEQEELHHLDRIGEALRVALEQRHLFDRLAIAAQGTVHNQLLERLPQPVRDRFSGWLELDLSAIDEGSAQEALQALARERTVERRRAALERLEEAVARPEGHGVRGVADVLDALNERRVEVLLLDEGFAESGVRSPSTGWIGVSERQDPADGTPTEPVQLEEAAAALAYEQAAEVLRVPPDPRLAEGGGIGAILRF